MTRRISTSLLTMVALVSVVSIVCQAQPQLLLTHHVREATLNGQAQFVGPLPATQPMRLVLVLPLRNQAALDNFLKELYDPSSASYRHFLTVEEFTARFGPSQEDYDAVIRFAETHGFTVVGTSRNRLNVDVTGPVASIEDAFHVTMGVYQHPTENRTFYAPDREPTPGSFGPAVAHRGPGQLFDPTSRRSCVDRWLCSRSPRPAPALAPLSRQRHEGGILRWNGSHRQRPVARIAGVLRHRFGRPEHILFTNVGQTNNVPITLLSTDGTSTSCLYSPGCDDTEQTLDMTQAIGMAPGMSSLVMYVGSTDAAIFNAMATASPLNAQLSSSWTWSPADPNTDNPYFEEFAAQGQNLFQAAGDSGKWTSSSQIYPADDVYLTIGGRNGSGHQRCAAVPGVRRPLGSTAAAAFRRTSLRFLPGRRPRPTVALHVPRPIATARTFRRTRISPFTSAPTKLPARPTNMVGPVLRRPCGPATWLWSISRQSLTVTSPVGFINPTLYTIGVGSSYDTDFHDITSGSNGYSATAGYDLATGWGSPNGSGLINALAGTSSGPGFSLSASPASVTVAQGNQGTSTITSHRDRRL